MADAQTQENYYVSYGDRDNMHGYDAVKATIEVVPTVVSVGISAWCGIDDGRRGMWLQVGWRRRPASAYPEAYVEWKTETGTASPPGGIGTVNFPGTHTFEVIRMGSRVLFIVGGLIYDDQPWANFDAWKMCKAQYGGETHADPGDHVPGDLSSNVCDFTDIRVRSFTFSSYSLAPLLDALPVTASHGHRSAPSGNSFSIWDDRTIFEQLRFTDE